MRHQVAGRTLGRKTNHRIAMWRNMAVSLFAHGQITTTLPKARSVKPFVEKLITAAKKGDLASRRRIISQLGGDKFVVRGAEDDNVERNKFGELQKAPRISKVLFDEIAPRYADRSGGYTRIIKLAKHRIGDGADLCVLQLVGEEDGPQVSGRASHRREIADGRTERAAKLCKSARQEDTAPVEEKPEVEAELDEEPATEEKPE